MMDVQTICWFSEETAQQANTQQKPVTSSSNEILNTMHVNEQESEA